MIEFEPWPKIPRLFRPVTVTEKIDGTNACIVVVPKGDDEKNHVALASYKHDEDGEQWMQVLVQSRKRFIKPESDNYGFAVWVRDNAEQLVAELGPGRHYGEWWGLGINRGYGLKERRFSLFNVRRWYGTTFETPGLSLVPVLRHKEEYAEWMIDDCVNELRRYGSQAAPGYDRPEGIVVFHEAANQCFKVTLENDAIPKEMAKQLLKVA